MYGRKIRLISITWNKENFFKDLHRKKPKFYKYLLNSVRGTKIERRTPKNFRLVFMVYNTVHPSGVYIIYRFTTVGGKNNNDGVNSRVSRTLRRRAAWPAERSARTTGRPVFSLSRG